MADSSGSGVTGSDPAPRASGGGPGSGDEVHVLGNIGCLVTWADRASGPDRGADVVPGGALAWSGSRILWAGPEAELPARLDAGRRWDAGGRLVVPGLVDCHTHLAFGGWRDDEFEARLRGKTYREIAREGGGILATVRATRSLDEEELARRSRRFLRRMARSGVTTVEAKSGYGLRLADELKQLRVYRRLDRRGPLRVIPTFLGAHAVPPEYRDRRDAYVDLVVEEMIPRVASEGLAVACDVFVEEGAFTVSQGRRILEAGKDHGLAPRIHADQLGDGGGARLAARVGALSADHLEHVSEAGIEALAEADVVAVGLPLASLYLDAPYLPARRLLEAGVRLALATDFNPGTAPSHDLPLALLLACTRCRLTPAEVLRAATLEAARACRIEDETGSLLPGRRADFAVMDTPSLRHWLYHFRGDACVATVAGGRMAWRAAELPDGMALPRDEGSAWG